MKLGGVADLFKVVRGGYKGLCQQRLTEGLVVDTLAYYNPGEKVIVLCKDLIEKFVQTHRVDTVGCYEAFLLYVLLHEHAHYVTDVLGLLERFSNLNELVRLDEPFCEYVALKSVATGVYRVFGYERRLETPANARTCAPLIATLHRPPPYSLFRELYAIPSEAFGIKAEEVLLSLTRKTSKLETVLKSRVASPEPVFSLRLALLARLSRTEMIDVPTLSRVVPARVVVA